MTITDEGRATPRSRRRVDDVTVSAVVVTHTHPGLARACLASLRPLVTADRAVIVINGLQKASALLPAALQEYGSVVVNEHPRGYGDNLNIGVKALVRETDYVLLLNDDLVFAPGAAERLLAALSADPSAGIAAPCIVGPDGSPQPAWFSFPSIRSEFFQAAILPSRVAIPLRARHARPAAGTAPRQVDWVLGAAMLVRRRAFDEVHGFDAGYFLYSEETDFCKRLQARGWAALSCGDAVVTHLGAASTSDPRFSRMLGRSRARYVRRSLSQRRQFALAAVLLAAQAWNVVYVVTRILLDPRTARDKTYLLKEHWHQRSILQGNKRRHH